MNEDKFRRSVVQTQHSSKEGATERHSDVVLWGLRISCLSPHEQLCLLGSAMFFCHVLQGIITELVAKGVLSGLMWAAAAIELSVYSVLSCIELKMTNSSFDIRTMPWRSYISIAACISVGRGLTWVGYGTLSYPTVLLFKSSKILVVMVTGIIILNKRFAPAEYGAAMLSVAGLYLFSVADSATAATSDKTDTLKGIALMLLAVCSEATVSTMQERALHHKRRPLAEMIFVTNTLGAFILLVIAGNGGQLHLLRERLQTHPTAILWLLATVVLAYGGSYAFTACIKGFGAVLATGVGIGRKFVSVLASYTLFPKPVNTQHVCGILLFFAGMLLSWSQQTRTNNTHNNTHTRPPKPKRAAHKHCGGGADMQDMQDMRELLAQDDVSADTSGGDISTDTSDISTVSTDTADEGLDSPGELPASAELVATPHGTPGTPTVTAKATRAAREGQEWGGNVGREQRGARRGERLRDCGASR